MTMSENIVSLCISCHAKSHHGQHPTTEDLLALSAQDHGCLQDEIERAVWLIRRLDRNTPHEKTWTAREWLERYEGVHHHDLS